MNIEINKKLVSTLEKLAEVRNITTEKYVEKYVNSHLESQYKLNLIEDIQKQKIDDIPTFEIAIKGILEDIKVRDYVEPTPVLVVDGKLIEQVK